MQLRSKMLKPEYKTKVANTTCTIYHFNSDAVKLAFLILRLGNYQQTNNEIMKNQGKTKAETI